jgi:hypothetical protein
MGGQILNHCRRVRAGARRAARHHILHNALPPLSGLRRSCQYLNSVAAGAHPLNRLFAVALSQRRLRHKKQRKWEHNNRGKSGQFHSILRWEHFP